jgi:hypothetical protein
MRAKLLAKKRKNEIQRQKNEPGRFLAVLLLPGGVLGPSMILASAFAPVYVKTTTRLKGYGGQAILDTIAAAEAGSIRAGVFRLLFAFFVH